MEWYYVEEGERIGPVSEADFQGLISVGTVTDETHVWNDGMKDRGFVYGQQKTIAHYNCTGDWSFYLVADEVLHESELDNVHSAMKRHLDNPRVEALVFDYHHFYGNHATVLDSPAWYRRAPRIIRNTIRTFSPDGLFFIVLDRNKRGRYPRAALANAHVYHYGWVRSEEQMNLKSRQVQKYWGKQHAEISYADVDPAILREFTGSHPAVMKGWLPSEPAPFAPDPGYRLSMKDRKYRLKRRAEDVLGLDLSRKHFRLI